MKKILIICGCIYINLYASYNCCSCSESSSSGKNMSYIQNLNNSIMQRINPQTQKINQKVDSILNEYKTTKKYMQQMLNITTYEYVLSLKKEKLLEDLLNKKRTIDEKEKLEIKNLIKSVEINLEKIIKNKNIKSSNEIYNVLKK